MSNIFAVAAERYDPEADEDDGEKVRILQHFLHFYDEWPSLSLVDNYDLKMSFVIELESRYAALL